MEIAKFWGVRTPQTPEPIDKNIGMGDYVGDNSTHAKIRNERVGDVVEYA